MKRAISTHLLKVRTWSGSDWPLCAVQLTKRDVIGQVLEVLATLVNLRSTCACTTQRHRAISHISRHSIIMCLPMRADFNELHRIWAVDTLRRQRLAAVLGARGQGRAAV
jgi:hypothetical protein